MAHSITYDARDAAADAGAGLVARLRKAWADYMVYRTTLAELSRLSDRELADLGIHRASITGIARESVYGA